MLNIDAAPQGSTETIIAPTFGPMVVGSTILDALEHNKKSASMVFANEGNAPFVSITILLNPISPSQNATIQIIHETQGYELSLSSVSNFARQLQFVDIPASFVTSFVVKNCTGVSLAASGNQVIVSPQYQL